MEKFEIDNNVFIQDSSILNFVSRIDFEEYCSFLKSGLAAIKRENNPRVIIIESWLMLDYGIRNIILWGISATRHHSKEFDLSEKILPNNFESCLRFIETFRNHQLKLPIDPNKGQILLEMRFWYFLKKEIEEKDQKIFHDILDKYHTKLNPNYKRFYGLDLTTSTTPIVTDKKQEIKEYRTVDDNWLKITGNLNEEWFKKARKLNKVRNNAAHSYNNDDIFQELGINGDNKISTLKDYSIRTICDLLKIEIKE